MVKSLKYVYKEPNYYLALDVFILKIYRKAEKKMDVYNTLLKGRLLPLVTIRSIESIDYIKEVIEKSGISVVEVAYRSEYAPQGIKALNDIHDLIVGAGTVRTLEQAKEAVSNGAKFIVTPALVWDVIDYAQSNNIPVFPGVLTPSEIQMGMEKGIKTFKIFPANIIGGLSGIKAIEGPYYDVKFLPTGGVNEKNYLEYLEDEHIIAVGGSFIINDKIGQQDIESEIQKVKRIMGNI